MKVEEPKQKATKLIQPKSSTLISQKHKLKLNINQVVANQQQQTYRATNDHH